MPPSTEPMVEKKSTLPEDCAGLALAIGQLGEHRHGLRGEVDRIGEEQQRHRADCRREAEVPVERVFQQPRLQGKRNAAIEQRGAEQVARQRGLHFARVPPRRERATAPVTGAQCEQHHAEQDAVQRRARSDHRDCQANGDHLDGQRRDAFDEGDAPGERRRRALR